MYNLNPKLIEKVFRGMPLFLTKRQKALFIYDRLCQILEYSLDYYLFPSKVEDFYRNTDNLQLIDGESRKDVVCYTFNAIYLRLLEIEGICDKETYRSNYEDMFYDEGYLESFHQELLLVIDKKMYHVDATYGVLDNNDLALSKIGMNPFSGWEAEGGNSLSKKKRIQEGLLRDIEKVKFKSCSNLKSLSKQYVLMKGDEYKYLSIQDKCNLYLELLQKTPEYSIASFSFLLKLRKVLFSEEIAANKHEDGVYFMEQNFVYDKDDNEYKVVFYFNPKCLKPQTPDFDKSKIKFYEYSVLKRELKELDYDEVLNRYINEKYILRNRRHLPKNLQTLKNLKELNEIMDEDDERENKQFDMHPLPKKLFKRENLTEIEKDEDI